MNNKDFWDSIKEYDEHRNSYDDELVCDMMVKEGLGQTGGGYFEVAEYPKYKRIIDRSKAEPSQAFHFFEYYIDDEKNNRSYKKPSYNSLKCPQLIMYIAEMAGLNRQILLECLEFIKKIEENANLVGTKKKGNYLEKIKVNNCDNCLKEYRLMIHIREIQDIISKETSYKKIVNRVSLIEKQFRFKVSTLYITQVKRKYLLEVRKYYNISKNENQKVSQRSIEKEEAILGAFKYFKMIKDDFQCIWEGRYGF